MMYTKKLMARIYAAGMAAVCALALAACTLGLELAEIRSMALGGLPDHGPTLSAPTGVSAKWEDSNRIRITWDRVLVDVSIYYVYRADSEKGPFVNIAPVLEPFYEDYVPSSPKSGGATPTWYYKVSAVSYTGGEGPQSDAVLAIIDTTPTAPFGLYANATSSGITISWGYFTSYVPVSHYQVYRASSPEGPFEPIAGAQPVTTNYTDTGLAYGTWYYKVSAFINGVEGPKSNEPLSATLTPPEPTGITVTTVLSNSMNISWSDNGADYYKVYRSTTSSNQDFKKIAEVSSGASYLDTGLASSTQYFYKVSACTNSGYESSRAPSYPSSNTTSASGPLGLQDGKWITGYMSAETDLHKYTVYSNYSGETFYFWWYDKDADTSKLVDIQVKFTGRGSETTEEDAAWASSVSYTLSLQGQISLEVRPKSFSVPGTYAIVFKSTNVRPDAP